MTSRLDRLRKLARAGQSLSLSDFFFLYSVDAEAGAHLLRSRLHSGDLKPSLVKAASVCGPGNSVLSLALAMTPSQSFLDPGELSGMGRLFTLGVSTRLKNWLAGPRLPQSARRELCVAIALAAFDLVLPERPVPEGAEKKRALRALELAVDWLGASLEGQRQLQGPVEKVMLEVTRNAAGDSLQVLNSGLSAVLAEEPARSAAAAVLGAVECSSWRSLGLESAFEVILPRTVELLLFLDAGRSALTQNVTA